MIAPQATYHRTTVAARSSLLPTLDGRRHRRLWRRWPTALGVAFAVLLLTGAHVQDNLAQLAAVLPLEYLLVAKVGRRDLTWPLFAGTFVLTLVVTAIDAAPCRPSWQRWR